MKRFLLYKPIDLKEVIIFSDGSLGLSAYVIYFRVSPKGRDCLKLVKANSKTVNSSVPVSEHLSRSLALEGLFQIISMIHSH